MMDRTPPTNPTDDLQPSSPVPHQEILIARIIDGEAAQEDRQCFEALADADPSLWKLLALRQNDQALLAAQVERELAGTDRIELPADMPGAAARDAASSHPLPWVLAVAGWAAVAALAAVWTANQFSGGARPPMIAAVPATTGGVTAPGLSFDEHMRDYLAAPYVLGEMAPTLLDAETISDGRLALRFVRRIEEVAFLQPGQALPVDDAGNLTKTPSDLRADLPPRPSVQ